MNSSTKTRSHPKKATADQKALIRIFSVPEGASSTLSQLEKEISENLDGFLRDHMVATVKRPHELQRDFISSQIPEEPAFVSDHAQFILNKIVPHSVHLSSEKFIGHMVAPLPYFVLPLSKIMVAMNQNLVKMETSKVFTPLEAQVIAMFHRLVYERDDAFYKEFIHHTHLALGVACSSGTLANMTALWAARNKFFAASGGIRKQGFAKALKASGYDDLWVLISRRGHYSVRKSCDVLGLGQDNVKLVDTDDKHRLSIPHLKEWIAEAKRQNAGILAVIGIAGTTETGAIDPLDQMAEICRSEGLFFHVDAVWGGTVLFSKKNAHLLKGIEQADSVVIDAHKQMHVPVGIGYCLLKDPETLSHIQMNAQYIIRAGSKDLGQRSIEGARSGLSLIVHACLHIIGRKGYGILIDENMKRAKEFEKMIQEHPEFEIATPPTLNILTYRYCPAKWKQGKSSRKRIEELNRLNTDLQKLQRNAGRSFVSRTKFRIHPDDPIDSDVLRVILANPLTTIEHLKEILAEQVEIGRQILSGSAQD